MKPAILSAREGILLVGHGTRDPQGQAEFLETARQVALARPELAVEPCFLEIASPQISMAVDRLAERGVQHMAVVPLLLFAAGHAQRDVPQAVREAVRKYPHLTWVQAEHLGCHAAILAESARRFSEAVCDEAPVDRGRTALVLVGRGSHDDGALREMHRFASLLEQRHRVGRTEVCFLAMAEPRLLATLDAVGGQQLERVIVQPHLLFEGLLLADLRSAVATQRRAFPATQWLLADRLGPTPLVCDAILDRAGQTVLQNRSAVQEALSPRQQTKQQELNRM